MCFLLFLLMSLYAANAWSQEFVCVFGLVPEGASLEGTSGASSHNVAHYQSGNVKMLILFSDLKNGDKKPVGLTWFSNRNGNDPPLWSAADLLDSEFKGSLAHYFKEMSYGALTLSPGSKKVPMKFYQSLQTTTAAYNIPQAEKDCTVSKWVRGTTGTSGMQQIVREVLQEADKDLNFSRLETSGYSEYDGDMDGKIDVIGVVTPETACSYSGTVFYNVQYTNTTGTKITVDRVITTDWKLSFPHIVGVFAHEYGHAMGLPELYDRDHISSTVSKDHSAGIGAWGTMGKGASWDHEGFLRDRTRGPVVDGPNPMCAWSRMKVGWITKANRRLVEVTGDMDNVQIHDINATDLALTDPAKGKVYKIEVSTDEYFLIANRQNKYAQTPSIGSFYDIYAPTSGLLIWHVDKLAQAGSNDANKFEEHKRVDLECADGLFTDKGYPGNATNSEIGGDNLDYWSKDATYRINHNGQLLGDAADVWTSREFTPYTNPSTAGYSGSGSSAQQTEFTGVAVRNITQNPTDGSVSVDIRFIPLAPTNFKAKVPVRGQVDLSWSAPVSNGAVITGYEYTFDAGTNWTSVTDKDGNLLPTASHVTIENLTGREYTFKVRAFTANEKGRASESRSVDFLSKISGAAKQSVAEVTDPSDTGPVDVGVYTYIAPNPNQPVWSLTGADADYFNLVQTSSNASNERTLQFKQPPNYEVPLAGGGYKTTYAVGVKVQDAPLSGAVGAEDDALEAILSVTVTVVNVEEAGSVVLSPLPPQVGVALVARLTDPDEGLTFTGASWAWQRRADAASDWESMPTGAVGATEDYPELSSYTPQMADVGYQLQATVSYDDNHGPDKRAVSAPTVAVVSSNRRPVLTGPTEAWAKEGDKLVTTYRATDPDRDRLTWSLMGTDADDFELFGRGQPRTLRFKRPPDFEQQATYTLTIGVSDGSLSATMDVTVRVFNVEEAGRVALTSTQPQVGTPLTATLSDPDGSITGAVWQWQRRADDTAAWVAVAAGVAGTSGGAELSRYTPLADDVGYMLQATVRYRDGFTSKVKTAQSAATEAVVGLPAVLASLTAAPGDGQVTLTWQAPASDGGAPITGYEYRQSDDGGTNWQPDWTLIADSDAQTTGHTVTGLTNGTAYTFEVRAVNAVGTGAARSAMATPVQPNLPPTLKGPATAIVAEQSTGTVGPYEADDPNDDALTWSLGGTDADAFAWDGTGATRSLVFKTPPDFEQQASYTVTVGVSDAEPLSATVITTVSVSNVDEAGTVALTSTPPQVGTPLTATLSDPDGSITGAVWQWQRRASATADWADVPAGAEGASGGAELSSYTPPAGDVGYMLQATVSYRDGHSPTAPKTAQSAATEAVVGPPAAVASLTAAPGDGQVVLAWQAPADGGSPITGYEYRQRDDGGTSWQPDWTLIADSDAQTTGHTVSGLTNGTAYTFEVRAVNRVGTGAARRAMATPERSNQPPTLKGPAAATVAEQSTDAIGPYEADDPDDDDLTWSLGGADASAFTWASTGPTRLLAFKTPPDFEQQASYAVSVSVDDGALAATVITTVSVSNGDEAGTVALTSTKPQVGTPLTATLSDPDGSITGAVWQWQRRASATAAWADAPAGAEGASGVAELSSYTPQAGDVGLRLQATVRYRDGHSPTAPKTAQSATTEGVVGPPAAVASLTAAPGDGQVVLAWQAPASDGGSPISGYEYRQSDDSGTSWQPDWTPVKDSDAQTTGHTVDGLTNGTAYTFEVRAVNAVGTGAARSATATPVQPNQPPTLKGPATATVAEQSTGTVGPYEADDPDDDTLTWSLGGTDADAFAWDGTGPTWSLAFKQTPDFEQQASYAVSVSVDDGALSATVTTTISVSNVDEAGTVSLSSTTPQVGVPLTATLSDPDGGITNVRLRWLYFRSGATGQGEAVPEASGTADGRTATLTPSRVLVETRIQAQALYDDGHGTGKSAESVQTDPVVDAPSKVGVLLPSAGDRQVTLTWSAAIDFGAAIGRYEYRYSDGQTWTAWTTVAGGADAREQTVTGLTNGTQYTFEVRAVNRVGAGEALSVTATPVQPNRAPTLSGPATATVAEQSTGPVGPYEADDPDDDTLTWTLGGTDADAFTWTGTGPTRSLAFKTPPDFEQQASYAVSVSVDDGALSATVTTTISVSNVDEAGTVSLSSTAPRVGTAIRATVADPDGGVGNLRWRWSYVRAAGAEGASEDEAGEEAAAEGASSGLSTTFTPRTLHVGLRLRARALYDDGHGSNKQAYSRKTDPVIGPPGRPGLSAAAGAGQVALTWTAAADHGSAIQRYEYRRSGGRWATVSGGANARSQTITGLSNCTTYTFEVRAVNGEGDGPAASASATLSGSTPPPPGLSASAGDRQVTLSWTAPTVDSCVPILRYEYRRSGGRWATVSGGANARSQTVSGLTNGTTYTFAVRAVNAAGDGSAASIPATPVQPDVDDPGTVRLSSSQPKVGQAITATLSDPDGGVKNLRWRWSYFRATGAEGAGEEAAGEEAAAEGASSGLSTTFTPRTIHRGLRLRVRALYDDGHGSNKQAQSRKTDAVIDRPGAPGNLSGRPGNLYTRVDLRWTAAEAHGAPITDYQYRYRRSGTSSWSGWTSVGVVTSHTVSGLQSGAAYAFQVRAVNTVGAGPSADTTGTVRAQAEEAQDGQASDEEEPDEEAPDEEAPSEEPQAEDEDAQDEEAPAAKRTGEAVPSDVALAVLAAPNPFNPTTSLQLHLPTSGPVWLTLYNITGQVVYTLLEGRRLQAGYHTFHWGGRDQQGYLVTSGVYVYQVRTNNQRQTGKMALIR